MYKVWAFQVRRSARGVVETFIMVYLWVIYVYMHFSQEIEITWFHDVMVCIVVIIVIINVGDYHVCYG